MNWNNGNEAVFRTVTLPQRVSFGSSQGTVTGGQAPGADGISYKDYIDPDGDAEENLIIFNPNGTSSESGTVYLTVSSGETFSINNLAATGRVKAQQNYGSGWSK